MNQNTKNVIIKLKSFCFGGWKRTIRPEKKELLSKSHDLPQFRSHAMLIQTAFLKFCSVNSLTTRSQFIHLLFLRNTNQKLETQLRGYRTQGGDYQPEYLKFRHRKQTCQWKFMKPLIEQLQHILAFVNNIAMNTKCKYIFEILISFPLDIYLEVELLNCVVGFVCFEESSYCFPQCS